MATKDTTKFGIFGKFYKKELAVASALATPARSEKGETAITGSHHPPPCSAFSVLPSTHSQQALSNDNANLFASTSDAD